MCLCLGLFVSMTRCVCLRMSEFVCLFICLFVCMTRYV